jgi:hypothetical protein
MKNGKWKTGKRDDGIAAGFLFGAVEVAGFWFLVSDKINVCQIAFCLGTALSPEAKPTTFRKEKDHKSVVTLGLRCAN